jgi:hypothetical protein
MRPVLDPLPIVVELAASGALGITWNQVDDIRLDAAAASNSDTQNLRVRFPALFDGNSPINGLYQPRFFLQGALRQADVTWNYLLTPEGSLVSTDFDGSPLVSPDAVPLVYEKNENITKSTYYDAVDKTLGVLQLQLAAGATPTPYDTDYADRQDPQLVIEFERQDGGYLAFEEPNPNSDHLWQFSDCDIYLNAQTSMVDGTLIERRHKIGWCADEDFSVALQKDTVNFMKGKPSATAVTFNAKINATITAKIAELDPWFFGKTLAIAPTEADRRIVYKETNKQRSVPQCDITFEWFTNAGHLVQFRMKKCQAYLDGELVPGGNEIARQGVKFVPLVDACNGEVYELSVSKAPIMRAYVCVAYGVTA